MISRFKSEVGYSLVEVMASIVILSIAIIPMVGMFDMGLNSASASGNYDKARTFVNERLEYAKTLPYATVDANTYPTGVSSTSCGTGCRRYDNLTVPASANLPSAEYRVDKQWLDQPPVDSVSDPSDGSEPFANSSTDQNLMRIIITVEWGGDNSYTASGVVAG